MVLTACAGKNKQFDEQTEQQPIKKIVKSKKESLVTEYQYNYDILNDKMVKQPNVKNKYYLVFTDKTYKEVPFDKYLVTEVGDTVNVSYEVIELF